MALEPLGPLEVTVVDCVTAEVVRVGSAWEAWWWGHPQGGGRDRMRQQLAFPALDGTLPPHDGCGRFVVVACNDLQGTTLDQINAGYSPHMVAHAHRLFTRQS